MDLGGLSLPQLTLLIVVLVNGFVFFVLELTECISPAPANYNAPDAAAKKVRAADWSFGQMYILTRNFFAFSMILFYAFMCEHHPPNPHGSVYTHLFGKHDMFWFVAIAFLGAAAFTFVRNSDANGDALLNRDQTEEWKGWMQFLFVEYHYFHNVAVYNPIRLFVSSYVWMTGFGNFSFFYMKGDFGFVRFAQMMWRLNFLVIFLCMAMNNHYILYYIVPLHTYYFLTV